MFDALWERLKFIYELRKRRSARCIFIFWAGVSIYDTFGSEFLPDDWAQKRPTVYQLVNMTSGWLTWEAWLLVGAAILVVFALEYVARHRPALSVAGGYSASIQGGRARKMGPFVLAVGLVIAAIGALIWIFEAGRNQPNLKRQAEITSEKSPPTSQPQTVTPVPSTTLSQNAVPKEAIEFNFDKELFGFNVHTTTGQLLVSVIGMSGKNNSDEPITNINAYVIPQNTKERLPLRFYLPHEPGLVDPQKTYGIPPRAEFDLKYIIPSFDPTNIHKQGIPVDDYLSKYGALKFVFEYDGDKTIVHEVSYADAKAKLDERQRELDRSHMQPPQIRPRGE
jgi:hypothetical protein